MQRLRSPELRRQLARIVESEPVTPPPTSAQHVTIFAAAARDPTPSPVTQQKTPPPPPPPTDVSHASVPVLGSVMDIYEDGIVPAWCYADALAAPIGTSLVDGMPGTVPDDDDDDMWLVECMYPTLAHRVRILETVPGAVLSQCGSEKTWYTDGNITIRKMMVFVHVMSRQALDKIRLVKNIPGIVVVIRRQHHTTAAVLNFAKRARICGVACRMFIM
jgi:hypothetical protein